MCPARSVSAPKTGPMVVLAVTQCPLVLHSRRGAPDLCMGTREGLPHCEQTPAGPPWLDTSHGAAHLT